MPWLLTRTMAPLLENWRTAPTWPQGTLFLPPKDFMSSERHQTGQTPPGVHSAPGTPLRSATILGTHLPCSIISSSPCLMSSSRPCLPAIFFSSAAGHTKA